MCGVFLSRLEFVRDYELFLLVFMGEELVCGFELLLCEFCFVFLFCIYIFFIISVWECGGDGFRW